MSALPGRFPDVVLGDLRGGRRNLSRPERATLVCIGHGDCGTTRLLLPYVDRIHRRGAPGHEVLAVLQDTPEQARALASELDLSLPLLLDPEPWPLGSALRLTTVPLTVAVELGGTIEHAWEAFRRADVEQAAALFGVPAPFFGPGDEAPALRPG